MMMWAKSDQDLRLVQGSVKVQVRVLSSRVLRCERDETDRWGKGYRLLVKFTVMVLRKGMRRGYIDKGCTTGMIKT